MSSAQISNADQPKGCEINKNSFSNLDHQIVREAVMRLPLLLASVVEMRFWENKTLIEIGDEIGVSERVVEEALEKAIRQLRADCLKNPAFSRSIYQHLKLARSSPNAA